jgi:hypothetical protein
VILTVTIPDSLEPYLTAAAQAAGEPDLSTAVAAHLAALISDSAKRGITATAMASVTDQVSTAMAEVAAQNALIQVDTQ